PSRDTRTIFERYLALGSIRVPRRPRQARARAFGWQLEQDARAAIERAGGRVIGHSRHPLNANNFLEYLDAAQDSGAKVIALANGGGDTINAVKQAAEIGISPRSQTLVPLLVFISDVHTRRGYLRYAQLERCAYSSLNHCATTAEATSTWCL